MKALKVMIPQNAASNLEYQNSIDAAKDCPCYAAKPQEINVTSHAAAKHRNRPNRGFLTLSSLLCASCLAIPDSL